MTAKISEDIMVVVQYTDGIFYTCKSTDIGTKRNFLHAVRYEDGRKYAARILIVSANGAMLAKIQMHLQGDVPYVRLERLKYTGIRLTYSKILEQGTKIPADKRKLYINEKFLPRANNTAALCYKFDTDENFNRTEKNVEFLEVILYEKEANSSHRMSGLFESSSADICSSNNGDTNSDKEPEDDPKSLNVAAIDSSEPQTVSDPTTEIASDATCCNHDPGTVENSIDNLKSLNVPAIDSSEPQTVSDPKTGIASDTTCSNHDLGTVENSIDNLKSLNVLVIDSTEPQTVSGPKTGIVLDAKCCSHDPSTVKDSIDNAKSLNVAAIDSSEPETVSDPKTGIVSDATCFNHDPGTVENSIDNLKSLNVENSIDNLKSLNVPAIDSSEPQTVSDPKTGIVLDAKCCSHDPSTVRDSIDNAKSRNAAAIDSSEPETVSDPKTGIASDATCSNHDPGTVENSIDNLKSLNVLAIDSSEPQRVSGPKTGIVLDAKCCNHDPSTVKNSIDNAKSLDAAAIDSSEPQTVSDPKTEIASDTTCFNHDPGTVEDSVDNVTSLNVTAIDSSELQTGSDEILSDCQTNSCEETDEGSNLLKATGVSESTTISSCTKPRIRSNEVIKFDLVRIPYCIDMTSDVHGLSIIGGQLHQDFSSPEVSADVGDVFEMESLLHDMNIASESNSYAARIPVMSSTIIESSIMSTQSRIIEDSSDTGYEDKDESYVQSGENDTTNFTSLNIVTDNESDDENTSVLKISTHKTSAPDDMNMHVATSATPSHTKKYFCVYCKTLQSKLARHLEYKHADEQDVKKFINLPVRNRERQQIIAVIRKSGNHLFNTDRRFNDGNLLVCRRPNVRMKKGAPDFLACANCKGQYARSVIRHHWRKCTQHKGQADRIVMVKGRAVMWRLHEKASELVNKYVFAYMREDQVVRSIRYDEILILYANKQAEQHGTHQHSYQMVRARMRLLGRLLIAIKRVDSRITDFASIFNPRCYDSCVAAVKVVANFDEHMRTFEHPAVAMNIGTLMKHVGELLRSECIKSEDEQKQKRVEDFLKLMSENFGTSINRAATETQMQNNRRKKVELPSIEDIKKLREYLKTQCKKCIEILSTKFSYATWRRLAEVTLVSLQIFNRRRAGEIERIYIEDYESSQGIDASANKEVFKSLSKEAQALALKYVRFMIRGKRGRGVPVLVPSELRESMNLIRKFRRQAKVPDENPYFYGLRSTDPDRHKYLRACDLLRQFAITCNAKVPNSLRGTKLRKHIATQCINLNLSETQVTDLANFMGHHERIHKEIYRQPIVERDITKMAKLLEIAQGAEDGVEDTAQLTESDTDEDVIENDINIENVITPQAAKASSSNKRKRETTVSSNKNKVRRVSDDNPISRRSWGEGEKSAVLKEFGSYLRGKKLPSKWQLEDMIAKNKCMKGRTAPQVKTWLHNERRKSYM